MDWKVSKVFPHFSHEYSYVGMEGVLQGANGRHSPPEKAEYKPASAVETPEAKPVSARPTPGAHLAKALGY